MKERYDNHCIITFMGDNWYIVGASPGMLCVVRLEGVELIGAVIDISKVDWNGYCQEAVEMLYTGVPS